MIRLPRLVVSAAVAALAISALAAPAAAADAKVAIVHGIAGARADICVDGAETKSGMRYGQKISRRLSPGSHIVKVFKYNPARRCGGVLLLKKTINVVDDADLTVVATKKAPKLVIFDNANPAGLIYLSDFFFRHAADLGDRVIGFSSIGGGALAPAAPTLFQKGDQAVQPVANASYRAIASKLFGRIFARSRWVSAPLVTSVTDDIGDSSAQFILVGDTKKNARFVVIDRT